jgi:hypothetical protein
VTGPRAWLGFGLLLVAIVAVAGYALFGRSSGSSGGAAQTVTVRGLAGGEKIAFLEDPQIQQILKDRYGIVVDATKAGSIEMVRGNINGQDFLWPSSQVALDLFKQQNPGAAKTFTTFSSPIVLYAWAPVAQALVKFHFATVVHGIYEVTDFRRLTRMILAGKSWKSIGLGQIFGPISIFTTDPSKSNSGLMFAGLLANVLNGYQVVGEADLNRVLPTIKQFYSRLGFLDSSSSDLFQSFLTTGIGAKPMIVGYENQLIEFGVLTPSYADALRKNIRILYPSPTVLSEHVLIALDGSGQKLLNALNDTDIQRLAWERHGFRSGAPGVTNDPSALGLTGIPATIPAIISVPSFQVMDRMVQALSTP